ncbi:AAEL007836-PA [Aedes aegypti]|uniref:AAEL007836-PA n=1 Tax=Aedes aegypti TaxID=7159 RepID=Q170R0_AEDAE|nr:AAEL007836-PA [Aedes aegypti]
MIRSARKGQFQLRRIFCTYYRKPNKFINFRCFFTTCVLKMGIGAKQAFAIMEICAIPV